jgi:hypothetical protein
MPGNGYPKHLTNIVMLNPELAVRTHVSLLYEKVRLGEETGCPSDRRELVVERVLE